MKEKVWKIMTGIEYSDLASMVSLLWPPWYMVGSESVASFGLGTLWSIQSRRWIEFTPLLLFSSLILFEGSLRAIYICSFNNDLFLYSDADIRGKHSTESNSGTIKTKIFFNIQGTFQ